jgi:hypothetical protein
VITASGAVTLWSETAYGLAQTVPAATSGTQPPLPTNSNINLYYSALPADKQIPTDISPIASRISNTNSDQEICVWKMDRRILGLLPEISGLLQHAPSVASNSDSDQADQPLFTISDKPPAGFESLNEPQTTMLDVYYNGRPLGSVSATYTLTSVTFLQPAQLAELIPGVKDKALVTQAFTKTLPAHADLVCAEKQPVPVCNLPVFNNVAVVFDVNKYRVDVFVSPNLLLPRSKQSDLLGPSSAGPSLRHDMNLAASGSNTSGGTSFNLVNQGSLANGSARLNYQTSLAQSGSSSSDSATSSSSPTQFTVQQLNAEWDHNRYLLQMGYIDTIGNTFVGNQNILGVNVGTTLNTLLQDKKSTYGSPLVVFLDLPSQVGIYRDNRLLASGLYPAGQQTLDTTSLPIGSYLVTLKIQDNLGNKREETRFFTKTQDLPPKDYPIYYANAGYLTNVSHGGSSQSAVLPAPSSTLIAQAGVNKRIGNNWGVSASSIATEQNGYLSSGLFFLLPYYQWQLKPEVIVGSDNDYGVALSSHAQIGQAQLSLNARRTWAKDSQDNNSTVNDSSVFDPLLSGQSQVDFNMGFPIGKTLINLLTQWSKSGDSSNYSYGVSSHSTLYHLRTSYLELNLSASRSSTESLLAVAALNWNFTGKQFSHRLSSSYRKDQSNSDNSGPTVAIDSTWRHYDAAQEGLLLGAGISQSPSQQTASINLDDVNDYSRITAQTSHTQSIGSSNNSNSSAVTQYSGNVDSQVVWADDAQPSLGVGRGQTAGVVVYIDSDQPGQEFQVLTNGKIMKVVKTNEFTTVLLDAYRSYELTIKAVSQDFFKYDERPKQVTLYPGNYQYLTWKARQKLVIFTQVLLPNKQPFAQAKLENGTDFNYTDEQGYIQLEIYRDAREVEFVQANGDRCGAELPANIPVENGFASLDSITCTPLPKLATPEQPSSEDNIKTAVVQSGVE